MLNIVVTAGGTSEPIDNVRKITNSSTGKLGVCIANELLKRSDISNIWYIKSKKALMPESDERLHIVEIESTMELKDAVTKTLSFNHIDYFIHSMAVSDYYVDFVTNAEIMAQEIIAGLNVKEAVFEAEVAYTGHTDPETKALFTEQVFKESLDLVDSIKNPQNTMAKANKISSSEDNLIVVLKQTPKIIGLIKQLSPKTHLFGFKLLDDVSEEELINVAVRLKEKNGCDIVIANDLAKIREGTHEALLVGETIERANGKENIAKAISSHIR